MEKFISLLRTIKGVLKDSKDEYLINEYRNNLYYCHADKKITEELIDLIDKQQFDKIIILIDAYLAENNQEIIYHYCSINSLFKIIESKKLWLSDSKFMNDRYEIRWFDKKLDDSIMDASEKKLVQKRRKSHDHYIICFSQAKDRLSQWRGYADDGRGVAIGFSLLQFQKNNIHFRTTGVKTENTMIRSDTKQFCLERMIYHQNEQEKIISMILEEETNKKKGISLFGDITSFKNPSFEEEREIRLIYSPNFSGNNTEGMLTEKKFRESNSKIIPYYEFYFGDKTQLLTEVIIGPKSEISEDELKSFLSAYGFSNIRILKSESSYQ